MSNGLHVQRARFADLTLAAYLSPLFVGRRVAVVGPTSGDVARRARALGAASVVAFGGVGEDIAVRALTPGAIAAFHGKIDVVLVPDAGSVPSLVAVLDEARRALGSEGVVAVASEPEDAPAAMEPGGRKGAGYHDLYELCAARFATVRMVGRGPFVGYTVAALDDDGEAVGLDTRLIDGDPPRPEAFLAVASDSAITLDAMAVVQVPGEVLSTVREAASQGLQEELSRRDQKLKEVEAASAERWVKIQRYEHGLKELEEESRKTRERAVRLSKELEDERKLRQRIELEAQMSRRAPELPRPPDAEPELRRLRDTVAGLERDLAAARVEVTTVRARVHDLERELDETQGVEADLRGQLDEALERADVSEREEALAAAQREGTALRAELVGVRRDLEAARKAVEDERETARRTLATAQREASRKLEEATQREREASRKAKEAEVREAQASGAEEDHARLETLLAARAAEARQLQSDVAARDQSIRELALTVEHLHGDATAREAAAVRARLAEAAAVHGALADKAEEIVRENVALRARLAVLEAKTLEQVGEVQQARWRVQELEAERARRREAPTPPSETADAVDAARMAGALAGLAARAREAEHALAELDRALADERGHRTYERARGDEARNEVSRLYALNAGLEARAVQLAHELEGAREGFKRRSAELDAELARVTEAVELAVGRVAADAAARIDELDQEAERLRTDNRTLDAALREARAEAAAREGAGPSLAGALDDDGADATAVASQAGFNQLLADLSATAERLAVTEETLARTQEAYTATRRDLEDLRERVNAVDEASLRDALDTARSELLRQTEYAQVMLAQLEDRDRRLAVIEQRWGTELQAMQHALATEERSNRSLRTSLEVVRTGLSSILIDGRGAVVAHDLVLLLRQIEANT